MKRKNSLPYTGAVISDRIGSLSAPPHLATSIPPDRTTEGHRTEPASHSAIESAQLRSSGIFYSLFQVALWCREKIASIFNWFRSFFVPSTLPNSVNPRDAREALENRLTEETDPFRCLLFTNGKFAHEKEFQWISEIATLLSGGVLNWIANREKLEMLSSQVIEARLPPLESLFFIFSTKENCRGIAAVDDVSRGITGMFAGAGLRALALDPTKANSSIEKKDWKEFILTVLAQKRVEFGI